MPGTQLCLVNNGWGQGVRWRRGAWALWLVLAAAACGTDEEGLGTGGDHTRRASGNAGEVAAERGSPAPAPAPTAPPPAMPAADPGNATVVIRAEKLTARRIVARLIYAEKIEAESSSVADLRKDDGKLWETEGAKGEQSFDELRADTIYSKEIRTGQLEAAQVFVKDLKIAQDEGDNEGEGAKAKARAKARKRTRAKAAARARARARTERRAGSCSGATSTAGRASGGFSRRHRSRISLTSGEASAIPGGRWPLRWSGSCWRAMPARVRAVRAAAAIAGCWR